jgi:serine/threonine protein phosphatase PrpC
MFTCPHCKHENQDVATLCSSCGAVFSGTLPTAPPTIPLNNLNQNKPSEVTGSNGRGSLIERPAGAIFGGRFLLDNLRYKDANEIRYTVVEQSTTQEPRFRICSNPVCGAVHPPAGEEIEQHCTQCGSPLQVSAPLLLLQEARQPIFAAAAEIANKPGGLAHPNVRAPVAYFSEAVNGETRYCLVTPYYTSMPEAIEPAQVLHWGIELARGLDFLHQNQLSFGGQVNGTCFGLDGTHPVWVNVAGCHVPPEMVAQARPADVRALAGQIYQWLTGHDQYRLEPGLPTAINQFFKEALTGKGYTSGEALAQAAEAALNESATRQSIDFRLGRRTDVGRERSLNEDSMVTLELNRAVQSVSQPLGLYAVADGMGGHSAGEIASGTIANTIARRALTLDPLQPATPEDRLKWLKETVEAANKAVFELRKSAGTDMGSTLVVALLDGVQAYLAHAGDSRIYQINTQNINQLTTDHSLVERLVATGQISREEARQHPQRNVVYRTIGDKLNLEIDTFTHTLAPGDRLLLCSDGLSGMVEDRYLHKITMEAANPQDACDRLIAAANAAGGEDNITVVVIQIVSI